MDSTRFPPADYTHWQRFFPPTITPRPAQVDDIRDLHHICYPQRPFLRFQHHFHHRLRQQERDRGLWLVLHTAPNKLIGAGQLLTYSFEGELADLFIHPKFRNQGLGTRMIHFLSHIARQQKLTALEIGVLVSNTRAHALYQRLGFQTDRQLHTHAGEAALIMRQDLT